MPPERTIQRILKVNHAGEYGAIRIYRAQFWVARRLHPKLSAFFEETLSHELEHCRVFREWMPRYAARPCRMMWLWSAGGYTLGFLTGLSGATAMMICTAAVERTVHSHLQEQIHYLAAHDSALRAAIETIQVQELEHLRYAEARCPESGAPAKALGALIAAATEAVIWLSTWGDVTRMRRELAAHP